MKKKIKSFCKEEISLLNPMIVAQGKTAFNLGVDEDLNPFNIGTTEYRSWAVGWTIEKEENVKRNSILKKFGFSLNGSENKYERVGGFEVSKQFVLSVTSSFLEMTLKNYVRSRN